MKYNFSIEPPLRRAWDQGSLRCFYFKTAQGEKKMARFSLSWAVQLCDLVRQHSSTAPATTWHDERHCSLYSMQCTHQHMNACEMQRCHTNLTTMHIMLHIFMNATEVRHTTTTQWKGSESFSIGEQQVPDEPGIRVFIAMGGETALQ